MGGMNLDTPNFTVATFPHCAVFVLFVIDVWHDCAVVQNMMFDAVRITFEDRREYKPLDATEVLDMARFPR
jgi:hypothetical protein